MSDIKNLKGRERLLKEYDQLTKDQDINNYFGIIGIQTLLIQIFFIGKLLSFLQMGHIMKEAFIKLKQDFSKIIQYLLHN